MLNIFHLNWRESFFAFCLHKWLSSQFSLKFCTYVIKGFCLFLFHFILIFILFYKMGGVIIKCSRGNKIQNHFTIKTLKSVAAHPESFRPLNLSIMVISCAEIRRMCYAYIHFSCDKEMCPSYKIILIDFIFFFDWIIFYIQILTWHIKASSTSSGWHSKPWS